MILMMSVMVPENWNLYAVLDVKSMGVLQVKLKDSVDRPFVSNNKCI